jgi:CBS domain containing-hemolysin-like protein
MRVEQAAQVLGADWRAPGETVGSYIAKVLGNVPATGEHVSVNGVDMIIEAVEEEVVLSARVLPPSPGAAS